MVSIFVIHYKKNRLVIYFRRKCEIRENNAKYFELTQKVTLLDYIFVQISTLDGITESKIKEVGGKITSDFCNSQHKLRSNAEL